MFAHVARCINVMFRDFVQRKCEGCDIDHPSQTQHICIMETKESLLDMFLLDLLEELCDNRLEECIDSWVFEVEKNQTFVVF
jgi:hypothetical protein